MPELWAPDSSPLIVLARAGMLDLLTRLSDGVRVTEAVAGELLAGPPGDPARAALIEGWGGQPVAVARCVAPSCPGLGAGELSVIALAREIPGCVAVMDDRMARSAARRLGVRCIGTLGVVMRAARLGHVPSAGSAIDSVRAAGLFVDDRIVQAVLDELGR